MNRVRVFTLLVVLLVVSALFAYAIQRERRDIGRPLTGAQILAINLLLVLLASAAFFIVLLTWQ